MKKEKPQILLDVDGVLRDTYQTIFTLYKKELDPNFSLNYIDLNIANLNEQLPKAIEEFGNLEKFFTHYAKQIYYYSPPIEQDISQTIKDLQKDVHFKIVSYQFNGNSVHTDNWLEEHDIPIKKRIYTNEKYKIKGDFLIDDSLEQLMNMYFFGNAMPVCYWQKYNRDWNFPKQEITSLKDVSLFLEKKYTKE